MQLKANSSEASQKMPLIMGFVCPHKTQNQRRKCNVIHHTKTRSEWRIINQIKDESKNMVEICEDCYIKEKDFLPRHTVFDYATWC